MKSKLVSLVSKNERLVKYFLMACIIVAIELAVFQIIYLSLSDYVLATIISFCVGVILNWVFGRIFIFKKSHRSNSHEFILVLVASLVGVGIQITVVSLSVQLLHLYPLIGKVLSIAISFVWNYWFRVVFIYKQVSVDE